MSVPNQMLYFASKLAGYETTPLQIFTDNGASEDYGPNGQIIFTLPSNTLVDLDSLRIEFSAACDTSPGTGVSRLPQDIHKLIRRVQVSAGGQDLGFAYDGWSHLKHGVDGITGREPHPTSHPRIVRTGLDPSAGSDARTAADEAKSAAIAAAEATLPTLYESTTVHIPLKAQLDGGANGVTPADGSINIIGRHSATKLSVCGYSADGYTKVMTETAFTWNQVAAAIQPDGAQLVPLFELLGFANYSTTQAVVDEIAAARAAIQAANEISTVANEDAASIKGVRFVWDQLGGFLETVQPRILDLAILPTITITLHLNSPECIPRAMGDASPATFTDEVTAAAGIAGSFTVSNPRLHINAIGFTTSAYDSYVSAALSKRAIELPFKSYHHYSDSNFLDSVSFQTSSRSVDKIHFQLSAPADRTIAADQSQIGKVDGYRELKADSLGSLLGYAGTGFVPDRCTGEKYYAVHYATSHNGQGHDVVPNPAATFYLNLNGTLQPSFPANATWWMRETTGALSEQREPWNGAGALFPEYCGNNCHKTLRLNRPGSTVQTASGVNTQNSMLYATLMCPSGLMPAGVSTNPARIDVWTEHTSLVRVVGPRDIEVVP